MNKLIKEFIDELVDAINNNDSCFVDLCCDGYIDAENKTIRVSRLSGRAKPFYVTVSDEPPKEETEAPTIEYFTHAHNIDGCLRNGSFVRRNANGVLIQYMNGDYMGLIEAMPKGMTLVTTEHALKLLPKCCGGTK